MNVKEFPKSPDEMPVELDGNGVWLRNLLVELDANDCASIHWECDLAASNAAGESVGQWVVTLENGRKRVTAEHEHVINALWFATELMDSEMNAAYEARELAKKTALAKLSEDDRRALGIRL